ncbi:MAG: hypothetical protein ABIR80_02505, partial [Opitutaceae bacterium]
HAGQEVARNDKWTENSMNRFLVETATARLGTFALDEFGEDAALVLVFPPGAYSVQVTGVANASGVALVEIYEIK